MPPQPRCLLFRQREGLPWRLPRGTQRRRACGCVLGARDANGSGLEEARPRKTDAATERRHFCCFASALAAAPLLRGCLVAGYKNFRVSYRMF
jgi:hypothetical protein